MMDPALRNKTAIVGVGYTPMERKSGRSLPNVAMEAAANAIADAGLTPADIDGYAGTPKAPNASALHWDGVDEISERYMGARSASTCAGRPISTGASSGTASRRRYSRS